MSYLGDMVLGQTFDTKFCTVQSTGAPTTLSSTPVISCYVGNGTTEITAGITLTADFDSRTGLNNVRVVATGANGYAQNTDNQLVITTGTVNSVSAVGYVVAEFSIQNRSMTRSTMGEGVGAFPALGIFDAGTAQSATSTTIVLRSALSLADDVINGMTVWAFGSTQGYWQARVITDYTNSTDTATVDAWTVTPSGTITYVVVMSPPGSTSVPFSANLTQIAGVAVSTSSAQLGVNVVNAGGTAWGSGAITAASIASDAITAAKIADNAIDAGAIASDAITAAKIASNAITAAKIAADAITSTQIADNAITANKIASNAITAAKIAADAIGATQIADNAIDAGAIAANAITAAKIATAALPAAKFDANDPVPVNVVEVNDVAVSGDGEEGTEWGPA